MGKFLDKFVCEKSNFKNVKEMSDSLGVAMENALSHAIEKWTKDNIDPIEGWPSNIARDEVMMMAATDTMNFINGMRDASKRNLQRIGKK